MEKVSVIIPTYNRANIIGRAIDSVLNQTYKNIEIIVIDDNSDDDTQAIINKYGNKVRYKKLTTNLGPSKARNTGIRLATGSLIAFQDSDDEWLADKTEQQVSLLNNNKDYGMVYCAYEKIEKYYSVRVPSEGTPMTELLGNIFESLIEKNKIGTPTMLIKREVLENVGLFNEELKAYEDWELAIRISMKFKIGYVNKALVKVYKLDFGVNSNYKNIYNARIFIAINYYKYVNDKERIGKNIYNLISSIECENETEREEVKQMLVPNLINEMEYSLVKSGAEENSRLTKSYEMTLKIIDLYEQPGYINQYLLKRKFNDVIIMGFGKIGSRFFELLRKENCNIRFIIDQNEGECNGTPIINRSKVVGQEGIVINTIPDNKFLVEELMLKNNFVVVNLYDI